MRLHKVAMSVLAVGLLAIPALGQDAPPSGSGGAGGAGGPPGGQRGGGGGGPAGRPVLPPEQAKQAWELEVKHLGAELGLNDKQVADAVKAYSEVREAHGKGLQDLTQKFRPPRGEDGQFDPEAQRAQADEMRKAFEDLNTSNREKLKTELAKSMTSEQVDKAMIPLGTFNPNWDAAVITVVGFKLEADKQETSMDAMLKYVTTIGAAYGSTDRAALRTANQTARRELNETMKPLLTEEQFGKLQAALAGGRGQMGGEPPAGGQRPRGARGGAGGGAAGGAGGTGGTGGESN